jgi:hypothetical protein
MVTEEPIAKPVRLFRFYVFRKEVVIKASIFLYVFSEITLIHETENKQGPEDKMISRRDFLKLSGASVLSLYAASHGKFTLRAQAAISGGTLEPVDVLKYQTPLLIPPVMPKAGTIMQNGKPVDYYEISMRQFAQQILPAGQHPTTTVWGYGAVKSVSPNGLLLHNAPSLTIEAQTNVPVRVKWINELKDANEDYLLTCFRLIRLYIGQIHPEV